MEEKCKFCNEVLKDGVKKCTTCGELRGLRGWVLRYITLTSVIVALGPLAIAILEFDARQKAVVRARTAEKAHLVVTRKLHAKDRGAEQALREMAQKVPVQDKDNIIKGLQRSGVTLQKLRDDIKKSPEDPDLQRKLFLFRTLKKPD